MQSGRKITCLRTVQNFIRFEQFIKGRRLYRNYYAYGPGTSLDYYAVLGVRKDATQRQIKAAYYKLSKKYHPDTAGKNCDTQTKFVEVNEAYECLRDPNRRRAYDNQTTGGGGRYTGDASDPFMEFQRKSQQFKQQSENPFHNREFAQQEYEKIWEQFNRMKNERESYDARLNYERQRIWEEFAQRRAQRWHEFHKKYPDGPPGSIKWDWSWSSDANQKPSQALKLFRRIVLIYMACFFVVTIVQLFLVKIGNINSLSNEARRRQLQAIERNDREKIEEMMRKRPMEFMTSTEMDYMNQMPISMDDKNSEFQEHDSSDAVYSSKLDDLGSNDNFKSEFSVYSSSK